MAIETNVVYVKDFDPTVPTGAEAKSDGDNHIRNLKTAALNTLPGFDGAAMVTGVDGGVANAYTLFPSTSLKSYTARTVAVFTPIAANTGAVTINISGLGIKPVRAVDNSELKSGDLPAGFPVMAVYDGIQFRLPYTPKNYIDQIAVSGLVPGVNVPANAGKFFTTDGASGKWQAIDLTVQPGAATLNKGSSGTSAQIVNYLEGGVPTEGQTITATGNFNLSAVGFPAGRMAGVLLRAINWGAYAVTSSGITWVKADKTQTAVYADAGLNLPAAGTGLITLFSYGDGTIYGKAA